MAFLCVSILAVLFTCTIGFAGELRTWTDTTGKFRIEAELVAADANYATLKKADGKQIRVPIHKLSSADQMQIVKKRTGEAAPVHHDGGGVSQISTYDDLMQLIKGQREAVVVASLVEGFLESNDIVDQEKELARGELPKWEQLADKNAIRVANKWITPDEFRQMKEDEIRLIKEAHRLIDIKSDELAKEKFLDASQVNPQSVRADFYLGLLNALVAHHRPDANKHFRKCIGRLVRDDDLLIGSRRANLVAALNNLAIIQVRLHHYDTAIGLWRQAIEIAPFTPELVQNLGLMAELSQTATYVNIPKGLRNSAAKLYAKVTVENSLARFDNKIGWLVIPYIDTLDGSMDDSGDEELVTVGWCTGFSIGGDYVVTSRYPLVEADRIVVHEGGNIFEVPSGKIVAISDRSNLALLRIDGLNGTAFPWSADVPKPAQDVTISGYREPGFTNETFQSRTATIVDLPNVLRHVDTTSHHTGQTSAYFRVAWFNYRDMLMHDAITSAGMEGAPLIDQQGRVVGVHIGNRPEFGAFGSKYSLAEPSRYAISFLKPIVSELDVRESGDVLGKPLDSQELQGLLKGSVYQLSIQRRAPRLAWSHRIEELHRLQQQGAWTSFEDKTCMACNGQLELKCPNRGCSRGTIRKKVPKLIATDERTGSEIWGTQTVTEKCPACGGKGMVDCPNCGSDGIDNMLR